MMKYPNVLGKDFKRKEDAYKHFQECRDEMVRTFQSFSRMSRRNGKNFSIRTKSYVN